MAIQTKFSEQVVFAPWIGKEYDRQSPRMLVLGESHYGVELTESQFTTEMIRRQFGEGQDDGCELDRYSFPKTVERIFAGKQELTESDTKAFWSKVVFYNFVQAHLADRSVRPTSKQFRNSVTPFCEIVTTLKPDVIVVFGIGTWNHLPNNNELSWERQAIRRIVPSPIPTMSKSLELWQGKATYQDRTHTFWSFFFPHPAAHSFGSSEDWIPWREAALHEIVERGSASAFMGESKSNS